MKQLRPLITLVLMLCGVFAWAQTNTQATLSGTVTNTSGEPCPFATIRLKNTSTGCSADENGHYVLQAATGRYTLVVSSIGYATLEQPITLSSRNRVIDVTLSETQAQLDDVVVSANGVSRVNKSAFNAVAIDAKPLLNSTKNLSEALARTPGLKLRESGGLGSDLTMMLDGFSGKHIKIFIDGIPQEGMGESMTINNIPINFADRIEVYKGVVPVGFGTDALGGVINIVTNKHPKGWWLDASYSYGSFNTHRSYVNFSYTSPKGLLFELNAFQNYSDNDYWVDTPVEQFLENGLTKLDTSVLEHVKRFNDTYHNEAVIGKIGVVDKSWADRMALSLTYSNMYKEVQTGVVQKVVFGQKHRKGHSLSPSLEYNKRNLFTNGLDASLTANYNKNITQNIDTATVRYNWLGEQKSLNGTRGEQSYQHRELDNDNWSASLTLKYRIGSAHSFTLNHMFNSMSRHNSPSLGTATSEADNFAKLTRKNITGLSYAFLPSNRWNASAFAKLYNQYNSGPVSTSDSGTSNYIALTNSTCALGYGAAGTYFITPTLQAKLSYEHALRLPSTDELFGDEDLELGSMGLKPEKSNNINFNLSWAKRWDAHSLYAEGSVVYRNTFDYIQRRIGTYTGNKSYASYQNHGKVKTKGFTVAVRYAYSNWLNIGFNITDIDVRDNVKTLNEGSAQANLTYGDRIPNQPYLFSNADLTLNWNNCLSRGNLLSFTYDNFYQHEFPLYSESLGSKESKDYVPQQISHNVSLTYSIAHGRYNVSVECHNLTDAKLYDNFSLQKAGRAFYGKVRVCFGNTAATHRPAHSRGGRHHQK
ncbi:MAG: TonB-dependent receptor domain-containing protein [Muribaculaceae bacterium]